MKVAIIGCTKSKKIVPCKAIEMYRPSSLFRKEVEYARRCVKADVIYILSAKYHLICSETKIAPYNKTLIGAPVKERREWACCCFEQIKRTFSKSDDELVFLCGKKYYEFLEKEVEKAGYKYCIPIRNIGRIGKQLQWLDKEIAK